MSTTSTTEAGATKTTLPTDEEIEQCYAALQSAVDFLADFRLRIARCSEWEEFRDEHEQIETASVEDIGRLFSAYESFAGRLHEATGYVEDVRGDGHLHDLDSARLERQAHDAMMDAVGAGDDG